MSIGTASAETYTIKNESYTKVLLSYPGWAMGQTFTTADNALAVNSVDLLVGAFQTDTSVDTYVEIRADSPTGTLIETSAQKTVSQQNPDTWVTFNFSGTQELNAHATYCLVVRHDSTKDLSFQVSDVNPVSGEFSYYDGSSWNDLGGSYDMAYRVNTTIATTVASTDATLSGLSLGSGVLIPEFASGTTEYAANVSNSVSSITVTPTANESHATITVNGITAASGQTSGSVNLNEGTNTITVRVKAEDGTTTRTYTITVNRAAAAAAYTIKNESYTKVLLGYPGWAMGQTFTTADNALAVNSVDLLVGAFQTDTSVDTYVEIRADSPTGTLIETSAQKTVSQQNPDTWVTFNFSGTQELNAHATYCLVVRYDSTKCLSFQVSDVNPISGEFSYYDGSSWNDLGGSYDMVYRVNTTIATTVTSTDATLSGLSLSSGVLIPEFASGTTEYAANVSNSVSSITVTPTANESHATITVNGVNVANGQASGSISLNEGASIITVVVKAQDGTTTRTYTITVNRAAASSTTITSSINPSNAGEEVSFRATVSPGAATGTVSFMDGTATLGSENLSTTGGVTTAVYTTSALAAGRHTITAVYNGDSNYDSSTSNVLIQKVEPKPASVATKVEVSGPNEITIPASGTASETYSAVVKDQYGVVMTGETVSWSVSPSTGVSIDASGIVTISTSASAGYYDVCASDGGASGGCVVKLKTATPTVPAPQVTLSNTVLFNTTDPTYVNMGIMATFSNLSGYIILDKGFISIKSSGSNPGTGLTLDTPGATIISAPVTDNQGRVIRAIKTEYGNTFYVRGYVRYNDPDTGAATTVYSDNVVMAVKNM